MPKPTVSYGRLAILKAMEVDPPNGEQSIERVLVFDSESKRVVYWVKENETDPVAKAREVVDAQLEKRSGDMKSARSA